MIMKEKGKIKKYFVIPYRKNEISSNLNDDAPSSGPLAAPGAAATAATTMTGTSPSNIGTRIRHEIAYDKYSSYLSPKEVIKHNLEILSQVMEMVKENPKNLDMPNVKDVLALFVYFAITLFYEAYYQYLMKISAILYEYNEDPRFEQDDLQTGIKYMDEVIRSLKVYKKILLNNFYDLFLPSRLTKAYGIRVDDNGYVICASKLAVDNDFLMKKYPFQNFDSSLSSTSPKLAMDRDALQQVNHFLVGKQRQHDLYDPKETLYIGFYLPNEEKMKELAQFYRYLIQVLNAQFSFAILLDNLISKTVLKRLPIELFKSPFDKIEKKAKSQAPTSSNHNLASNRDLNAIITLVYKYLIKSYQTAKALKAKAATINLTKTRDLKEREEQILLSTYYYNYAMTLFHHIKAHQTLPSAQKSYLINKISKAIDKVDRML